MIRSKLPEEVLVQLEIQNGADNKWSVNSLTKILREYVIARERAEKRSSGPNNRSEYQNRDKTQNRVFYKQDVYKKNSFKGNNGTSEYNSFAQALVSTGIKPNSVPSKEKQEPYANKCQKLHWSDECTSYRTIGERKKQLRGSCFKCLKEGHKSQDCKTNKKCVHCGEINSHHRSLCPNKFQVIPSSVHLSEENNSILPPEESEEMKEAQVLISSDEMVLMQTAKRDIVNPTSSEKQTQDYY
ncbi:uncharacterized protein LOC123530908 [Mercenaria mercenaria]|uniref:uncharacterized protein LOC123530908 n=1 Tax=Mercenaria mercenaria TaxID=6596 RepID=UPI00234FB11F|nr:uncharacterized protein LOC123530908 [Mercenaria mercenaria]